MNWKTGIAVLFACAIMPAQCFAAGATALGEPAQIAKDGVAIFTAVKMRSFDEARKRALDGCKNLSTASTTARALCKIVAAFENQCVAQALDPQNGTPGFGWAIARNSTEARRQALINCRSTAGPTRQDACIIPKTGLWCDGSAK